MKRIFIIATLIILILPAFCQEYKIINTKTNKEIELKEMTEKLGDYNVIFFGEFHGNEILHSLEFELLKMFHSNNKNLIISLEMFERDVQTVLDGYLNDKISEEEFLKNSRPWPNYETDYKPLIEFAKENELTVVAANIPRRYANMISKQGLNALDSLSVEEKKFVTKKHIVFEDEYKEIFIRTMKNNMAHSSRMPKGMMMNLDLIYAAQCIKDDTMAESILKYHRIPPRRKVIHFNGDFHSRKHLGTAQKIQVLEPMLKVAVITPLMCEDKFTWKDEDLLEGEFLILLKEEVTEEEQ
ncbi:MAG: ChaN family lipoprotein [Candidatus Cloacimonadota bacterium]|nr:ChaN family lipoprotein [Candidatus Cloacimonadota bacterium]